METLIQIVDLCEHDEVTISRTPAGNFLVGVGAHTVAGKTLPDAIERAHGLLTKIAGSRL